MQQRRWRHFLIAAAVLIALASPAGTDAIGVAVLIVGVGAIFALRAGARWWLPSDKRPLYVYAVSIAMFSVATILRAALEGFGIVRSPNPADLFDAAGYVFGIAATLLIVKRRAHGKDPTNLLDSVIAVSSLATLAWIFVVLPYLRDPRVYLGDRIVEFVFTLEAMVMLAVILRLAIGPGRRNRAFYLLTMSFTSLVALELVVGIQLGLHSAFAANTLLPSALGAASAMAAGAAALHPSIAQLTERSSEPVSTMNWRRVALMGIASAIPPVVLVFHPAQHGYESAVIVISWLVVTSLVVVRLAGLASAWQRARDIERILSRAAAGLSGSSNPTEMHDVVLGAMSALIGPGSRGSILVFNAGRWTVAGSTGLNASTVRTHDFVLAVPRLNEAAVRGTAVPLDVVPPDLATGSRERVLFCPMVTRGTLRGALLIVRPNGADQYMAEAVTSLSHDLAVALETVELIEETNRQRAERRFRSLVDSSDDIIAVVNAAGATTLISPAAARLLDYEQDDISAMALDELVYVPDRKSLNELIARADEHLEPRELRFRKSNNDTRWFEVTTNDLRDDPEIDGVVVTAHEITERKRAEVALAQKEARLHSLLQNSSDVVAVLDADRRFTYVSGSVAPLFGYRAHELTGTAIDDLIDPDDVPHVVAALYRASTASTYQTIEIRLRNAAGDWRIISASFTDRADDNAIQGVVFNAHDVTDRVRLEESLRHRSLHDSTTELPNRLLLEDRLSVALTRRGAADVALIVFDIDDLRTINDAAGHAVGDEVLRTVAQRLRESVRPTDTAARLGGDDFSVLMDDVRNRDDAVAAAQRVLDTINQPVVVSGLEIPVSVSLGIVFATDCGADPDHAVLLRNAELAMYVAKSRRSGDVVVFEEGMHKDAFERLKLKADLVRAVANHELELHYQPIVALDEGHVVGFEALVRWRHPTRGMVSPGTFIPIAEETGEIVAIGEYVLGEALARLRSLQQEPNHRNIYMSVNVSPQQLSDAELPAKVAALLKELHLDPAHVTLELTESSSLENRPFDAEKLRHLRALGVQLAADDFGSGFASYAALSSLPFTGVKIDMSLVRALSTDGQRSAAQIRAICDMARQSGLTTVAEGVEDADTALTLVRLGCPRAQGYYFGRPSPPERLAETFTQAEARLGGLKDLVTSAE